MAVVSLACWWHHRARLVYDWHNMGYTIMAQSLGRRHWLVSSVAAATMLPAAFQHDTIGTTGLGHVGIEQKFSMSAGGSGGEV